MIYPSHDDLVYLAGLVDGEGYIGVELVGRGDRYLLITISVVNTNRMALDWIAERFGGAVRPHGRLHLGWKASFAWRMSGEPTARLLARLYPHLIIKKEQAWLAQEAWAQHDPQRDKRALSDEVLALRRGYYLASRFLNRRGTA